MLEITPRILHRLGEYNIYLLEDLLRFVKKNGFNALAKLHGIGMKSCEDLYSVLKRKGIMESKDNCHLFQYIWRNRFYRLFIHFSGTLSEKGN